ncbi:MAG TPA: hypothetical protein VNN80_33390 [Polyangiaceae bacterium]|nr:hypothetical protein [Polyangiaceae bacterium]
MRTTIATILPLIWLCGCADSNPNLPYPLGQALVIGQQEAALLTSVDESCDSAACQAVRERCGEDAYADVVVDQSGQVLDVLCFRGNAEIREIEPDAVESASAGNNTVLVLDDIDDGADVTGSVVLAGNNAVLYGHGTDVSQVGALDIEKNNAIVRGVSILGDVTIDKNNAQLSFCEIRGDLTILGNNTTLAECVVHGQVRIEGVNTVLVNNQFATERELAGKNLACNGNVAFDASAAEDAAPDGGTGDAEAPSEIACDNLR